MLGSFFYSSFLGGRDIVLKGLDKREVGNFHLFRQNQLLPAPGPHHLLHVPADHGQGKGLKGPRVVLVGKAVRAKSIRIAVPEFDPKKYQ